MLTTKEDWIKTGFKLLRSKGVDGIKVEVLSRMIGVTKGGFYGYFLNREAFLQALLDDWENRHGKEIFYTIDKLTGSPSYKLQKLLYMVDDKKYDAIELSIYYWAAHDPRAQKVLMRVDSHRAKQKNGPILFITSWQGAEHSDHCSQKMEVRNGMNNLIISSSRLLHRFNKALILNKKTKTSRTLHQFNP